MTAGNDRWISAWWQRCGWLHARVCLALFLVLSGGWLVNPASSTGVSADVAAEIAERIVQASGLPGGICVLLGCEDSELAIAVAKHGRFTVQCLVDAPEQCTAMRREIRAARLAGTVSVDCLQSARLPYGNNLVNMLIWRPGGEGTAGVATPDEMARVLAPLGSVCVPESGAAAAELVAALTSRGYTKAALAVAGESWTVCGKPWPAEIDQWTHYLHGADGNPVAADRVVGPPRHFQWTAGPAWLRSHESDSSVSTLVTAQGRLFSIVDHAPASLLGPDAPTGKWYLEARDAFNGVLLWQVPIHRWGWREWKNSWFTSRPGDYPLNIRKQLVAVGDHVYVPLGYHAPVSQLDARSGAVLRTYDDTRGTAEVLVHEGTLVLSVLGAHGPQVMAVDAATGATLWRTSACYRGTTVDYLRWNAAAGGGAPDQIDPALNIATDGQCVVVIDGPQLVGLDFATGRERWRADFPLTEEDQRAGGIAARGSLWNGTMIVCQGAVIHASPYKLAAFSADTGKLLWAQPKAYIGHLWYEWKDVFVIGGLVWTWSAELERGALATRGQAQRSVWPTSLNGYDLGTGTLTRKVPVGPIFKTYHHHRCYRNKATLNYVLTSRRGTEFVDLAGGEHSVNNWVRGTCHVGMMPANGLQYAPPHPCVCYAEEKLNGFVVLAPASDRELDLGSESRFTGTRLVRGPAFDQVPAGPDPAAVAQSQWPAFRHDGQRTGGVSSALPTELIKVWTAPLGGRLSAPIAAAGCVWLAAIDQHHVVCLDAQDGHQRWEYGVGGRVDSPPTYFCGRVVFGAADGWVYCLRASDGRLVWKFLAAPEQRWMGASSQLESVWPVHGSVLVRDGLVYLVAGRSSHLDGGLFLYALDARTGTMRYRNRLQGPEYRSDTIEQNFELPMGTLPDILVSEGERVFMRTLALDETLQPVAGRPALQTGGGLLDDSYFKRAPWRYDGQYGRLLVHDQQAVYYVRMFDSLKGLDPTVYFTPAAKGYELFSKRQSARQAGWRTRVPIRIRALALADRQLIAAGMPDEVDARDPWGAFEGRRGGRMLVVPVETGDSQQTYDLDSPPVFNGIAIADGRLVLVGQNGQVTCWGSGPPQP